MLSRLRLGPGGPFHTRSDLAPTRDSGTSPKTNGTTTSDHRNLHALQTDYLVQLFVNYKPRCNDRDGEMAKAADTVWNPLYAKLREGWQKCIDDILAQEPRAAVKNTPMHLLQVKRKWGDLKSSFYKAKQFVDTSFSIKKGNTGKSADETAESPDDKLESAKEAGRKQFAHFDAFWATWGKAATFDAQAVKETIKPLEPASGEAPISTAQSGRIRARAAAPQARARQTPGDSGATREASAARCASKSVLPVSKPDVDAPELADTDHGRADDEPEGGDVTTSSAPSKRPARAVAAGRKNARILLNGANLADSDSEQDGLPMEEEGARDDCFNAAAGLPPDEGDEYHSGGDDGRWWQASPKPYNEERMHGRTKKTASDTPDPSAEGKPGSGTPGPSSDKKQAGIVAAAAAKAEMRKSAEDKESGPKKGRTSRRHAEVRWHVRLLFCQPCAIDSNECTSQL